jgi:GAF domain-containing protein/HAMP domain-containing protein
MKKSFRTWLAVAIISSALLPLGLAGMGLVVQDINVQQRGALNQQRQRAEAISTQISALASEMGNIMAGLTRVTRFYEMSMGERHTVLSEMLAYRDADWRFEKFTVLDSAGRERLQVTPQGMLSGAALADRSELDMFTIPKAEGMPYYHLDRVEETSNLKLTVAVPIFDLDRALAESASTAAFVDGVVVAEVNVRAIQDKFGVLQLGQGESVCILNEQVQILAAYPPELWDAGGPEPVTSFAIPEQQGLQRGVRGNHAMLAMSPIELGSQTLYVIAEKSLYAVLVPTMVKILILIATLVVTSLIAGMLVLNAHRRFVQPLEALATAARTASLGDASKLGSILAWGSEDAVGEERDVSVAIKGPSLVSAYEEIGDLAHAFNNMTLQLRETVKELGDRVAVCTAKLERRTLQLDVAAQIARDATEIQDMDSLLDETIHRIAEYLDFDHVALFLLDEDGDYAILRAISSRLDRQVLIDGYRVAIEGDEGVWRPAAQVARAGEPYLALGREAKLVGPIIDDSMDATSALSKVSAAMILPLKAHSEIIGILDVRSITQEMFDDEAVSIMQMVADQMAMTISNLTLYQKARQRLEIIQQAYGKRREEEWMALLQVQEEQADADTLPESRVSRDVRGDILRSLHVPQAADNAEATADTRALIEVLLDQLAVALDSARLYQDTQQHAARERLMRELTARMHETLDVDSMLKMAIRDIHQALNLSEVTVRLAPQSVSQEQALGDGE